MNSKLPRGASVAAVTSATCIRSPKEAVLCVSAHVEPMVAHGQRQQCMTVWDEKEYG